jgi:vacuolar-type H+-ATPase subunit I/STV1
MSNIIHIYKAVKEASQNEALAQAIAEAFDEAESRYPNLANTATQRDLSETELRLIEKIEVTRGEIKETELRLMGEIEKTRERIELTRAEIKETELRLLDKIEITRGEIKETELRLMGEIEKTRLEIKDVELKLTKEIESVRTDLTKEMGKQSMKTVSYLTAIMGLFYTIMRFVPA